MRFWNRIKWHQPDCRGFHRQPDCHVSPSPSLFLPFPKSVCLSIHLSVPLCACLCLSPLGESCHRGFVHCRARRWRDSFIPWCQGWIQDFWKGGGGRLGLQAKKGGGRRGSNFGPIVKKPTSWHKRGVPDPLAPPGSANGCTEWAYIVMLSLHIHFAFDLLWLYSCRVWGTLHLAIVFMSVCSGRLTLSRWAAERLIFVIRLSITQCRCMIIFLCTNYMYNCKASPPQKNCEWFWK